MNIFRKIFSSTSPHYESIYYMPIGLVRELRRGTMSISALPSPRRFTAEEVVEIARRRENIIRGTAFAVSPNHFVTCNHVIEPTLDTHELILHGSSGPPDSSMISHRVTSIQRDNQLDLALMETEAIRGEIKPIRVGRDFPPVGLDIIAVGFPLPEQAEPQIDETERKIDFAVTVTFRAIRGIVASKLADGLRFEIDKLLNRGQSGGPVVAIKNGELVGMCQAFRHYVTKIQDKQVGIAADLSLCLSTHTIRNRLIEWGCEI